MYAESHLKLTEAPHHALLSFNDMVAFSDLKTGNDRKEVAISGMSWTATALHHQLRNIHLRIEGGYAGPYV